MRVRLDFSAAQTLCSEPRKLVSLEKIYIAALEWLAPVAREVEDRQILADEATYPNRCFTREQRPQCRVNPKQAFTREAGGAAPIRVIRTAQVKTSYRLKHAE
jgi:hypothetical protein